MSRREARSVRPRCMLALVLAGALAGGPALAHRLSVFASAEGALISGSAWFVGGRPAHGVQVQVLNHDGAVLATLQPDADGRFSYRATAPVDHLIVVEGADGHRAEWPINAEELAGAFGPDGAALPTAEGPPVIRANGADEHATPAAPDVPAAVPAAGPALTTPTDTGLSPATLAAIEAAVARQVRPLRETLAAAEAQIRLRDVLGGLGWLAGLAGLGLWWTARRRPAGAGPPDRPGREPPV